MVALPQVHNTADLPDTGGNSVLIPNGQYQAIIVKSEMAKTKSGHSLNLTVVITQGAHQNTEFIERLNIDNPSAQAMEISYKKLARISEAFGMTQTPADSDELHNKPLMIEIKNKVPKDWVNEKGETVKGVERSEIYKYMAIPANGVPAQQNTEVVSEAQPQAQATNGGGDAPANNPFAPKG